MAQQPISLMVANKKLLDVVQRPTYLMWRNNLPILWWRNDLPIVCGATTYLFDGGATTLPDTLRRCCAPEQMNF